MIGPAGGRLQVAQYDVGPLETRHIAAPAPGADDVGRIAYSGRRHGAETVRFGSVPAPPRIAPAHRRAP